jgi:hypothetical protein
MSFEQDEFLKPNASFIRLYDEYKKYGSLTIGFDFDGTVHDYHLKGETYYNVIELLRELKDLNCKLICWTAYKDLTYVERYLYTHNIPCDGVNTDGIKLDWESRKPFFSALLDDRAGLVQVYNELKLLIHLVK